MRPIQDPMPAPPLPTRVYHITKAGNLPAIIQLGCLVSNNIRTGLNIDHKSIANREIQDIRATREVESRHGGVLHDYVPFYFCPRSPMLASVQWNKGQPDDKLIEDVVHLVSTAQAIVERGLPFCYTSGHAIMDLSDTFEDLAFLDKLDWDAIDTWKWKDPEVQRRKQAEFLVRDIVPWDLVQEIGVLTADTKAQVETALMAAQHRPRVYLRPKWYVTSRR
jgi:hypothetical protein